MTPKGIAILGATGSIGRSALTVLEQHPDRFRAVVVTAHRSAVALAEIAARHRPAVAILTDPPAGAPHGMVEGTQWAGGRDALLEAVVHPEVDIVLNALVGAAGLEPTLAALGAGKRVALANKESLVSGGPLVMSAVEAGGGELIPVDSEHSAILQCLRGCEHHVAKRLILTASGGPFRTLSPDRLAAATREDALRHPTWRMGAKITIDSATLANKALEVIEAHFLFGAAYEQIEVVVHPQSIIHSMVEFADGSVLAQLGFPTMELPVLYALSHPERIAHAARAFDPVAAGALTFEPVRADCFPAFALGIEAGKAGGTAPAAYNAANEIAVGAFLEGAIPFPGVAGVIRAALDQWEGGPASSLEAVLHADACARRIALTHVQGHST